MTNCQCGEITGEACSCKSENPEDFKAVYFVPDYLRGTCKTAHGGYNRVMAQGPFQVHKECILFVTTVMDASGNAQSDPWVEVA